MGCQQAREKSNAGKVFQQYNPSASRYYAKQKAQKDKQNIKNAQSLQVSGNEQNKNDKFSIGLEGLNNIRNNEDLAKLIVKKLIQNNEIHLSIKLRKQSEEFYGQGKYEKALETCFQATNLQRQNENSDKYLFAQDLLKLGDLQQKVQKYDDAFNSFREILDLDSFRDQKQIHQLTLDNINQLSETLLRQGKLEKALLYKKEVLNFTIFFFGEKSEEFKDKRASLRIEVQQYEDLYKKIQDLQNQKILIDESYFNDENECMICCKEFQVYEKLDFETLGLTKLRCNHVFHSNCINQWFLKQQNCPYCRGELTQSQREIALQQEQELQQQQQQYQQEQDEEQQQQQQQQQQINLFDPNYQMDRQEEEQKNEDESNAGSY